MLENEGELIVAEVLNYDETLDLTRIVLAEILTDDRGVFVEVAVRVVSPVLLGKHAESKALVITHAIIEFCCEVLPVFQKGGPDGEEQLAEILSIRFHGKGIVFDLVRGKGVLYRSEGEPFQVVVHPGIELHPAADIVALSSGVCDVVGS